MREPTNPTAYWAEWRAASGHPSGKWRVVRYLDGPGVTMQQASRKDSKVKLWGSYATAKGAADILNAGKPFDEYKPCATSS